MRQSTVRFLAIVVTAIFLGAPALSALAAGGGGDPPSPVMVPFTRAVVPSIELAAGRLVLDPPPGLLDESEA